MNGLDPDLEVQKSRSKGIKFFWIFSKSMLIQQLKFDPLAVFGILKTSNC